MERQIIVAICSLVGLLLPDNSFERIKAAVGRWDDKLDPDGNYLSGDEKCAGVKQELELLGIKFAQFVINAAINLAVLLLRAEQGKTING